MITRPKFFSFAADAFTSLGAAVEFQKEHFVALLPEQIAELLALEEEVSFALYPSSEHRWLSLSSPLLDELLQLTLKKTFLGSIELSELSSRSGGLRDEFLKTVRLIDARGVIEQVSQGHGHYLIVHSHFSAQAGDLFQEGLVSLAFNEETLVETPWLLDKLPQQIVKETSPSSWRSSFDELLHFLHWRTQEQIHHSLQPFLDKLQRRFSLRRRQLERFHRHAAKELLKKAAQEAQPDTSSLSHELLQLQRNFVERAAQLPSQWTPSVRYRPFAFLRVSMPITRLRYSIQRRKQQRSISWIWNPLIERFEPRACEITGRETFSLTLNDQLQLFDPTSS